jgi:hypothetical protein
MSALLAFLLVLASLIALYEVAQTPRASSHDAQSLDSIRTIRRFYAGLNAFMDTGDANAVANSLAPGALAFAPDQGVMGQDSGLLTYLLALRSTYPKLRFTVEQIDAGDDIAIATVRRSGAADHSDLGLLSTSGTSREFFRVRDGRIVQHWSTAPESMLRYSLTVPPVPVTVFQPGHLAIAELTFAPNQHDPHLITGPALVFIHGGRRTLTGDGSAKILDIATGITSAPELNEGSAAGPGQALLIPQHHIYVWNRDAEIVTAWIATIVEDHAESLEHLPADRHPPPLAINNLSILGAKYNTTYDSVAIRPLEYDLRSIPTGTWDVEVVWAVLGPGASLPLPADGEWALAQIMSGTASRITPDQPGAGRPDTLTNMGEKPALALVIWVRPTH